MKIFILAISAALISLVLAQLQDGDWEQNKGKGYSSGSYGRFGSSHGRYGGSYGHSGYGYGYKRCPKLERPENGWVRQSGTYPGSKAVHACNKGFILVGKSLRVCQKDGTFSGEAPTCEPVDCGSPDAADPNGSVDVGATTFKNSATYSCNEGYWLDLTQGGSEMVVCQADGQWSDTAPSCKPVDCGYPPQEDINGEVSYEETTLNNIATYVCNSGYTLSTGEATHVLTCLSTGQWSEDSPPSCDPVDCGPAPSADPNGAVAVGPTTFRSRAIYSCNVGFLLDTSEGRSQYIYCQANGQWSGVPGGCVRINCGYLATPSNGVVDFDPDTSLGSSAQFKCIRGYRVEGGYERVCQADGEWSLEQPSCIRVECPELEAPENGKVKVSGNYVDDYAVYRCGYGHVLIGESRRVCQQDGTWSGEAPKCQVKKYYPDDHYGDDHYGNGHGYGRQGGFHGNRYGDKKDY